MSTQPNSVYKTTLENGLTVVLKEMHHAPVTSFWVWYKVGSRNERPGNTGAAHWVEHMMFKGTPMFPDGVLDRVVSREGGRWNAFTWIDFTAYYETMPSNKIDIALKLEADRMVNTVMKTDETESERTVIISERHMNENYPSFHLREEMQAAAFRVHPYHHLTIGDETDLETMTRDDLYRFYKKFYVPNNATVVVVGDFDTAEMLKKVKEAFGNIPRRELETHAIRPEPAQKGVREVTVNGSGATTYLTFGYKSPPASSDDYFALALLNAAFSGGGSLGMFGSGTTNKSSRLYKALVSTELAVSASGGLTPTIDPYLYKLSTILRPGGDLDALEEALNAEIGRLWSEPITQEELDKARKRAQVEFVSVSESITGQAQMIGMSETILDDYSWFETALDKLKAVTIEDINRVRDQYLDPTQKIIGRYIPQTE